MKGSIVKILLLISICIGLISCAGGENESVSQGLPAFYRGFENVEFSSSEYSHKQKAIYHKSSESLQPLIVSLHTWGGDYKQIDSIALMAIKNNWNYIHPDYGGRQWTDSSCCYTASVQDIDDAIAYAIERGHVDTNNIVVIGKSGGGSGVLAAYLQSEFSEAKFYSWSPIPDYLSWYDEVKKDSALSARYLDKILLGTQSVDTLNTEMAKRKSPSHFDFSQTDIENRKLVIYVGIYDGLNGWSTSINQGISFYNKACSFFPEVDSASYVSPTELAYLFENRIGIRQFEGTIGNRDIVHREVAGSVSLVVFDGGHEIIYTQVASDLTFD